MALPVSGQLTFEQIGTELSISTAGPHSLRAMSSTAGFSVPDQIEDFYGYSAGSPPPAPAKCNLIEGPFSFTGSWFHADTTETGFRCEFKINGGSWQYWGNAAAGATTYIAQINGCSASDTVYFRVRAYNGSGNSAWCEDPVPATASGSGCI
jgi:hypothetical protein